MNNETKPAVVPSPVVMVPAVKPVIIELSNDELVDIFGANRCPPKK